MAKPTLKLIVDKGPRKGETLECKPGSNIRIGRIIKGNNFTIKDYSISQKHLFIEFNGDKWVVSDLDTSNGTLLNDVKLQSMEPLDLNNGDVIKIGESTTLNVMIEGKYDGRDRSPETNRLRRNPRRGARAMKEDEKKEPERSGLGNLGSDGCMESNGAAVVVGNRRRRGGTKGTRVLKDEVPAVQTIPKNVEVEVEGRKDLRTGDSVQENLPHIKKIGFADGKNSPIDKKEGKDLENMTLGEWFDRMERYLPKQIHDISEEIISSMRARAQQFQEFISMQQGEGRGKLPMN